MTPSFEPILPGDTLGVWAPSGALPDPEKLPRAERALKGFGYRVKVAPGVGDRDGYSAGTPEARVAALLSLIEDPEVKLIMAARGGFGMSHLLPLIDWDRLAEAGKVFVGFSDFTAFHLGYFAKTGQISLAGPMAVSDFAGDSISALHGPHFFDWLKNPGTAHQSPTWMSDLDQGSHTVHGRLWGGNLSLLSHLVGTPYFPMMDEGILFIEEIGEAPYRIERMWMQLELAGVIARQKAIVFGAMTGCESPAHLPLQYSLGEVIERLRRRFEGPIVTGLPFGHIQDKITLPFGGQATLNLKGSQASLSFDPLG